MCIGEIEWIIDIDKFNGGCLVFLIEGLRFIICFFIL